MDKKTPDPIIILEPNPNWPQEFEALAQPLRKALGSLALAIDHIGSTAVPDLAAKDIIDIQITVKDLNDTNIVDALTKAGYNHRGDVIHDNFVSFSHKSPELRKHYFREAKGTRVHHIHIREQGRLNQRYALLFRDFLLKDTVTRQVYGKIKTELARRFTTDKSSYYAIKDPLMDSIYQAAELWAHQTNWKPPLSSD